MSKGGSKIVTGIISFILGFIFAILVEIGAVFGVYWFVMNNDINTVMAAIGIPNTDDRYINTDKENGGVSTLKELLAGVKGLVYENGELSILGKSFDDINNLIPATQMVLDMFYSVSDDYIELDKEAFQGKPMTELAVVLSESVLNIKTGPLLEKLNVLGDDANLLVKSLVMGSECDYATVRGSELKLPVMYDYFMLQEGNLARVDYNGKDRPVNDISAFPHNLRDRQEELLAPSGKIVDGDDEFERYTLYYVPCKVTADGIEEAEYSIGEVTAERDGKTYKFQIVTYGADTDFIAVEYNNGEFEIDFDQVYAALNEDSTDLSDRFTGYSYYEPYATEYYYFEQGYLKTLSGKNYFRDSENKMVQLDALTLYDIIADPFSPLDSILVSEVMQGDTEVGKIFGTTTLGALLRGDGIDEIIEDLEVSTFIDNITPDNKVMCYIAYKISDLQSNGDNTYTAIYDKHGDDEREVTVNLNADGYIVGVEGVNGVKVREVATIAKNFTDRMTVGDVLGLDGSESQLLAAIKDTPLSGLANRIEGLTVGEIISKDELQNSSMLRQLKNTKVTELATAIDKLFIQRVYAEQVYGVGKDSDPALATEYQADLLYYKKVDDIFVLANTQDEPPENDTAYDDALGHITEEEFGADEYYTYGEATGMWRLVLYKDGREKAYTMNNFNNMVNACADNVYKSTLYDLQKAGVIESDVELQKTFGGKELGTFTMKELIAAVILLSE